MVGENLIDYPDNVSTPIANITMIKAHLNNVISDTTSCYMCLEVKDFYLNNPMSYHEYICISVKMILKEFMDKYNLWPLVDKGFIYAKVRKCMYALKQARK